MITSQERLSEIDIIRILAKLIIIILIQLPHDYVYNYYLELDSLTGYFLNTLCIYCSVGSFNFVSDLDIYLQKRNRYIDSPYNLFTFLQRKFVRIFTQYWITLLLFVLLFDFDIRTTNMTLEIKDYVVKL